MLNRKNVFSALALWLYAKNIIVRFLYDIVMKNPLIYGNLKTDYFEERLLFYIV